MIICLHHKDGDGYGSAAVVKMKYPTDEIKFIGMDYSMNLPLEQMNSDDTIIIVDFSPIEENGFAQIQEITDKIIWIDHHQTAIEKHKHFDYLDGIRRIGTAACDLCWEYFFPGAYCPEVIKLLGDYDVWKFEYGDSTRNFQAGIRMEDMRPTNTKLWDLLLNDSNFVDSIINKGSIITEINNNNWMRSLRAMGYVVNIRGTAAVACNMQASSAGFDSLKKGLFSAMIVYNHDGKKYKVTIYSDESGPDVSVVAKEYGGGGHEHAAGFYCENLPFKYIRKLEKEDFK